MKKELTCIVCPIGCRVTVETNESGEVISVCGNTCPRGEAYAKSEVNKRGDLFTITSLTEHSMREKKGKGANRTVCALTRTALAGAPHIFPESRVS